MTNSTQNNQEKKYFDYKHSGVAYVYRTRKVSVPNGKPYWSCDLSVLEGEVNSINYTRLDCNVCGAEAEKVIESLNKACQEKKKILIGFTAGGLKPEIFIYPSGDKKGEPGISLKTRLIYIAWAKVDGVNVYKAPSSKEEGNKDDVPTTQADETPETSVDDDSVTEGHHPPVSAAGSAVGEFA